MCGFVGFLRYRDRAQTPEPGNILQSMGQALSHRGPDDVQYHDDGILALAYRRLAIVDIKGGRQPILNENGDKLIAVNGQIYNHVELRDELKGRHQFSTHSDCEVPLHAFEEWGVAGLERCSGMYAMAIWDSSSRRLLLARDRLGIKPLYVVRLRNGLLFGSELKALLFHPDCPREMDWTALPYERRWELPTASYVEGVELLPGGHCLEIDDAGYSKTKAYWRLEAWLGAAPYGNDAGRYQQRFEELLEQAVLAHLQGEAKIGLHLSGGLDSSLLAAIIAPRMNDLPCFTLVERTTWCAGDVSAAKRLTASLGLPWHPILFDYRSILDEIDFDLERFEQAIWMMDSPRFDLEWLFKEELHRAARTLYPALKVILLGQGVDEFAGGYSTTHDQPRQSWSHYLTAEVEPLLRERFAQRLPAHLPGLLDQSACGAGDAYHRMMQLFSAQLQHHNLWHEDRTSMWHSLEARVPFLDHALVELLASIPSVLHEKLFWNKQIVRDAMRRIMPGYDSDRPKIGFTATADMRSIGIIVQQIVLRLMKPFREKYYSSPDTVFDRDKLDRLMCSVATRDLDFNVNMWLLLDCMAITVFRHQCHTASAVDYTPSRLSPSRLVVIAPDRLEEIGSSLEAQPSAPIGWPKEHILRLPAGTAIMIGRGVQTDRFALMHADKERASIELATGRSWVKDFLSHIDKGMDRNFTVSDWMDEYDVSYADICQVLDVLCQCGIVLAPLPADLIPTQ